MSIFLTGATGYLGSYVVHRILEDSDERLSLLVRAGDRAHALDRLWRSLQLHRDAESFAAALSRIDLVLGDLTAHHFGLDEDAYERLARGTDSVLHIAASLNRKSAKACFNTNLRGTLQVLKLARAAHDHHGLRRFSDVSTVAVAGHRDREVVYEDHAVDWDRSDYDPYARTKKLCEHMLDELLPDVPHTVFRPSIILGDSRFPETTQFDMVRSFCFLAALPALPFEPGWHVDIVPADFVGAAVAALHMKEAPGHRIYHLSAGRSSLTYQQIVDHLRAVDGGSKTLFLPRARGPFGALVSAVAGLRRRHPVVYGASLLEVFWPYLTYDTVFDNRRVCRELGATPAPFTDYAAGLYRFAVGGKFRYPYRPWPDGLPSLAELAASARPTSARRTKTATTGAAQQAFKMRS